MYGAIIGDIVGSNYEFDNIKTKDFEFFGDGCDYTDDTVMTVAVASAIIKSQEAQNGKSDKTFENFLVEEMQSFGRKYPYPKGAYGGGFSRWLREDDPQPYNSFGNGSAMRVSACGIIAVTLEEAQLLAEISAKVTHDHPEGIKGAKAVASAIFMAKCGKTKDEIRAYINNNFYSLNETVDEIREYYMFDSSCQGTVPQAIICFLESTDFEDAIRNAISIGGDSDTIGAITGSIALMYYYLNNSEFDGYADWVYYKNDNLNTYIDKAKSYLPQEFVDIAEELHNRAVGRQGTHFRTGGFCSMIVSNEEMKDYNE